MAKKVKQEIKVQNTATVAAPMATVKEPYTLLHFRVQAIILAAIGFVFYCNTFSHEFAFDDLMAIVDNEYVQQGVTGIPGILTKDAFQSYQEQRGSTNQLAGGRYRPLSLITFAIEQQFLGINSEDTSPNGIHSKEYDAKMVRDMHVRHVVNVLLYMLSVVVLLYFFRQVVFRQQPIAAFIAALLFTIHPLHTEVVANVKSRDEILSVLFISLTFIQAFKYRETSRRKYLIRALLCFFLALLSKEYAALLMLLLPISFYIFDKDNVAGSLRRVLPFAIPFALYIFMRLASVTSASEEAAKNIQNYPYLYATTAQKTATEIVVLLRYPELLFWPHPLCADYSFRQIPYTTFADPAVWLSLLVYLGLAGAMVWCIARRRAAGFALAFYLVNLLLVSNILFNVGAPMGERLAYHSSVGFAILVATLLTGAAGRLKAPQLQHAALGGVMAVLILICGYTTMARNPDWKNNNTLFLHDVKTAPASALMNSNAAAACMSLAKAAAPDTTKAYLWFNQAIAYFTTSIQINPTHMQPYVNRGICYFNTGNADKALADWDTARVHEPASLNLERYFSTAGKYFISRGIKYARNGNFDSAIILMNKGVNATPANAEAWAILGRTYMDSGPYPEAKDALGHASQLSHDPNVQALLKRADSLAAGAR